MRKRYVVVVEVEVRVGVQEGSELNGTMGEAAVVVVEGL